VYDYQVTQYNPETNEGVIFVDYIKTFFKLKGFILAGFEALKKKTDAFYCFRRVKESD